MALGHVVTRGYGNGTFAGTIPFVVTRGYTIGEVVEVVAGKTSEARVILIQADDRLVAIQADDRVLRVQ